MNVPLVYRAGWRHLRRHPWQSALAVLAVTLGVAVVVAVDLTNQSAVTSLRLASEAVFGRATHHIVGGPTGVPEGFYVQLRRRHGTVAAAPVIEAVLTLPGEPPRRLTLLGLDLFAEARFRGPLGGDREADLESLLLEPGAVLLPRPFATAAGIEPGAHFAAEINARPVQMQLAGYTGTDLDPRSARVAVADIATAQELLAEFGRLSRIDLILEEPAQPHALQADLPAELRLREAESRARANVEMTRAFRTNLTALSGLALLVGAFLIYNSLSFLVVQRHALIGTLRALGAARLQLATGILIEAALLGLAGTVLGLAAGVVLATSLMEVVTPTIQDHYFSTAVVELRLAPASLFKAAGLGLLVSLAAALGPALEVMQTAPRAALARATLESRARRRARLGVLLALPVLAVGVWCLAASEGLAAAFAGQTLVLVAAALATPALVAVLMAVLAAPAGALAGLPGRLAAQEARASLSRTGPAVAALMVAVSALVGVAVMIASFRASLEEWLDMALAADFYVSVPGPESGNRGPVPEALAEHVASLPGVAEVSRSRWVELPTDAGSLRLRAFQAGERGWRSLPMVRGPAQAFERLRAGMPAALVSEPLAQHLGLSPGDTLTLPAANGAHTLSVTGIYRDYGSERGAVTIARSLYLELFDDSSLSGLGIYAAPGTDRAELRERLERLLAAQSGLMVRDNRELKRLSLAIFERTFTVTEVLRVLAALVAFAGIFGALMAYQLERSRELAVLRALGFTPAGLFLHLAVQSLLLGTAAGLVALPTGTALGALLTHVINRRAFGWGMEFHVPAGALLEGLALAAAAGLLAGLYPAWRAARSVPAKGLREE